MQFEEAERCADPLDEASNLTEKLIAASIASHRKPLAPGEPGECDRCGEESLRLVNGNCARCRDKYGLP